MFFLKNIDTFALNLKLNNTFMLLQFTFSNYKCFREENILNLAIPAAKSKLYFTHRTAFNYSALKALVVLGANASGKTKLFDAVKFVKNIICPPKRSEKIPIFDFWQTQYDSFRLNTNAPNQSSTFEMIVVIDEIQYRYGLELNKNEIISEWLYTKNQRETFVFIREAKESIRINKRYVNERIYEMVHSANMLSPVVPLLVILATFNDTLSQKIVNWFNSITIISANDIRSIDALHELEKKDCIVKFLKSFDINIEDISLHEIDYDSIPNKIKHLIGDSHKETKIYDGINTMHKVYNELYERDHFTQFSLEKDESYGTNRLFGMSWPIINSLRNGTLLLIDEFDSGIHSNIIDKIVRLYYLCNSNAQLLINTQNTSLLNNTDDENRPLFTKEQIYLVNKNLYGEANLLPVTDFDEDFRTNMEKLYLGGYISGVPYVDVQMLLNLIKG